VGNGIKQLVWVRGKLGGAGPSIQNLKTNDGDLLIYGAYGKSTTSPATSSPSTTTRALEGLLGHHGQLLPEEQEPQVLRWYSPKSGQNYQPPPSGATPPETGSLGAPARLRRLLRRRALIAFSPSFSRAALPGRPFHLSHFQNSVILKVALRFLAVL
jgi:hypothetical protein